MRVRDKIAGRLPVRLSAIVFALVLMISASIAQNEHCYEELPNFHQVNAHLYRGAQPRPNGGIRKLTALGVKSIINLREEDNGTRAEEAEARAAGLKYYSVPMEGMGRPSDEQINRALAIINAPDNWPIYVHCKRGADRTGTVIAIYRISHDNWTVEHAIQEARQYGLSRFEPGMKHYIEDYAKHTASQAVSPVTKTDRH